MKKIFKRTLSALLVLIMLFTAVPLTALAADETKAKANSSTDYSVQGGMSNIVNTLSENEESSDYFVSDVIVNGKKATVEYAAITDCKMVVAIYNEDTLQMLGSGVADVTKDEKEAEVEINISKMPDNYLIKVFLLGENNEALCRAFSDYKYTNVYEEFLEKTPEDFKGEEVVPFDDEADDFGVLQDDVASPETSSKMTYTYDEEAHTFVFKNAISEIKNLKVGEILYYECSDVESDFILLKVKKITVSGSTVTIVEDEDVALDEAFKFLRIDADADFSDVSDEDVKLGSCLEFDNSKVSSKALVDESTEVKPYSTTLSLSYPKSKEDDPSAWSKGIKVEGKVEYAIKGSIRLYYDANWGPDYYDFKIELSHELTFSISASAKVEVNKDSVCIEIPADFGAFSVIAKVYPIISFEAEINAVTIGVNVKNTAYVTHDSDGIQKHNDVWSPDASEPDVAKIKLEFKLGVGMAVEAKLGKGVFASVELAVGGGLKFTADIDTVGLWTDKFHDCYFCLKGDASVFVEGTITFKLQFFKEDWALEWEPLNCENAWHFNYFYISFSKDGFKIAFGECHRIEQKVTVTVYDEDGKKLEGATVSTTTGRCDAQGDKKFDDTSMKTDKNGQAVFYFKRGSHSITASADEHIQNSASVEVLAAPKAASVELKKANHILTVNVVDEEGKPIKGAKLTAVGDSDDDGEDEVITTTTDSKGVAMLKLAKVFYDITVSADNHKSETFFTYVYKDEEKTVTLEYQKTYELKVKVSDEDGKALSGASVTATGDSDGDGINEAITSLTNSSGVAELNLPEGDWEVSVSLQNYKSETFTVSNINSDRSTSVTLSLNDLEDGNLIEFGSYPQSLVKDSSLKSSLDSVSKTWISYGYYSGTGSAGTMYKDSWMKYADVTYGGNKYRAVTFSQYRPYYTCSPCSSGNSHQDNNGYITNTVYYFKYEPLKWRVLDPEEGLVMCESIIDSQAYSDTIYYKSGAGGQYAYFNDAEMTTYANDYATSSIREWLNDDFYNTAFTSAEKSEIGTTTLDNSCWSSSYPEFDSATTNDKIFLLSYDEVLNTDYGFSSSYSTYDTVRRAKGTDYAKCQGLWVSTSSSYYGNSYWRLRSPDYSSFGACVVSDVGYVYNYCYVNNTNSGIRPAFKFNLKSGISKSSSQKTNANCSVESNNETYSYISKSACVAGRDYLLLNVTGYSADFVLTSENLLYIDQVTADKNGRVDTSFIPKKEVSGSTTLLIGDFGKGIEVKRVTEGGDEQLSVSLGDISMNYKSTASLNADIVADADYVLEYSSSNPSIVSVDENGNITATGTGEAQITVKVTDEYGNIVEDTCKVTVSYVWWQWLIIIFLFGWIWY